MEASQIEEYIAAILWGKTIVTLQDGRVFIFRSPSIMEKNYAQYVYKDSLEKYRQNNILQDSDALLDMARFNDEWTEIDDNYFYKFDELIKVAYENMDGASRVQKQRIEKQIENANKRRDAICKKYNYITAHSVEQQAAEDKIITLIKCVTEHVDGTAVWPSLADFNHETDHELLSELLVLYLTRDSDIDMKTIRTIARSAQWRIRWAVGKENIAD